MKTSVVELLKFKGRHSLPVMHQTELAECGLTCLAMIATYHGYKCDLVALRSKHAIPLTGASLKSIMSIAEQLNLSSRPVKVPIEQLAGLKLPSMLHWNLNHFVVLESVKKETIVVHDPARGRQTLTFEEVSNHYTGIALELMPTKAFEIKNEQTRMSIFDFGHRIIGLKKAFFQILGLSLLLQIFLIASPIYMQTVIDEGILSNDSNLLSLLAIGFGLLALFEVMTSTLRSFVILTISSMLSIQMANNLFRHLIRLPLNYFENRHIGDTVSRFGSLNSIKELLTTGFVEAIVDGIMSTVMLVMLFLYSPKLTFIALGALCIYFIVRLAFFHPLKKSTEETITTNASEQSNFMETVRGIQAIKLFTNEKEREVLWQNRFADSINASIKLGRFNIGFSLINGLLFAIENVVVIYLAALLILEGDLSIGMLYAFVAYKQKFMSGAQNLIEKVIEFKMIKLHLDRIADIAKTKKEIVTGTKGDFTESISGSIKLVDLGYRYSGTDSFVFDEVNLSVTKGESIAIIGPSGCGKSTLLKVMIGLFSPTNGTLHIDDKPLKSIGLESYRTEISAVMQNDKLFSGTIADNISFFDPQPDHEHIKNCAQQACIHDEIERMPMKYHSLVGDMGTTLSGGQLQRVLIARALYKKPRILFLDEASSHLDSANESNLNQNIKNMRITRVVVAHRQSTIRQVDNVYMFFNGRLVHVASEDLDDVLSDTQS